MLPMLFNRFYSQEFDFFRDLCNPYFQKYSSKDRLLLFVKPRAIRLLDIIRKFSPEQIDQHSQRLLLLFNVNKKC